jgi:hypothetical protein
MRRLLEVRQSIRYSGCFGYGGLCRKVNIPTPHPMLTPNSSSPTPPHTSCNNWCQTSSGIIRCADKNRIVEASPIPQNAIKYLSRLKSLGQPLQAAYATAAAIVGMPTKKLKKRKASAILIRVQFTAVPFLACEMQPPAGGSLFACTSKNLNEHGRMKPLR